MMQAFFGQRPASSSAGIIFRWSFVSRRVRGARVRPVAWLGAHCGGRAVLARKTVL